MPYRVTCPGCQAVYRVPDDSLGKRLTCQKCRRQFAVGDPKPPSTSARGATAPGRTTTEPPPRPPVKAPPRSAPVKENPPVEAPPRRGISPLVIGGAVAALLVAGAAIAGGIWFLKSRMEAPVTQEAPPPGAPEEKKAAAEEIDEKLPPDLDLVPGDGAIFLSLQVAQTWKDPTLAPVRKLAETDKNIATTLLGLKLMGLAPDDVERAVAVFWGKQKTPYSVGLVTMVKPYDRQLVLGLIGEGQREEKVGDKSILGSPKSSMALHLIDERSFVYGRAAEVKKLLERPARPTRNATWNEILRSAPQHTLLIGVQHDALPEDLKKQTPPFLKSLEPLLDAHTAVAALDADKDLRLSMRLMFAREEEVKQAESAARTGLELAAAVLGQFAGQFKKQPPGAAPPSLGKFAAVMQDAEAAVKKATIQTKGHTLTCEVNVQSADWPDALASGAAMLFAATNKSTPPPKAGKPAPGKVQAPKTPKEAEAAIKRLGGTVERDKFTDGKPIVRVSLVGKKVTDDDLVLLRPLTTLTDLSLISLQITNDGLVHLKHLKELDRLDLGGNDGITDAGLAHLKGLAKLKTLRLLGTRVSDKGAAEFKKARPDVNVVH